MTIPSNDRLRLGFQEHLQGPLSRADSSITEALRALSLYEEFTGKRPFGRINRDEVMRFNAYLHELVSDETGKKLSASTIVHILGHLREFFSWLVDQKGFRSIGKTVIEYFNPPNRTKALAKVSTPRPVPTMDELIAVASAMPSSTREQRRDRALLAFLVVYAVRANAVASWYLDLLDPNDLSALQDATRVRAKLSVTARIFPMPVGGNLEEIIRDWANELRALGVPHDAPLFPKEFSGGVKSKDGSLSCWSNSHPVRRIAKAAFLNAGLDYFNPHSFRKAITRHFLGLNISIEEFLAISINLCHKSPMTTLEHYGTPTDDRRAQLIKNIGSKSLSGIGEHASAFLDELKKTRPKAQAKILTILSSPDTD